MIVFVLGSLWFTALIAISIVRRRYAKKMAGRLYGGPRYCEALEARNAWTSGLQGLTLYPLAFLAGHLWISWAAHFGFLAVSGYLIWRVHANTLAIEACELEAEKLDAARRAEAEKLRASTEPWIPTHTLYANSSSGDLVMLRNGAYWTRHEWKSGLRPLFVRRDGLICTYKGSTTNLTAHPLPSSHVGVWRKIAKDGE